MFLTFAGCMTLIIGRNAFFSQAFITNTPVSSSLAFTRQSNTATTYLFSSTLSSIGTESISQTELDEGESAATSVEVKFSHVHFYTDHIEDISVYKDLEDKINSFSDENDLENMHHDLSRFKDIWQESYSSRNEKFVSQNRDVVKQLIAGLGFRVTATSDTKRTKNVLVTTKDQSGVQFVVSALDTSTEEFSTDAATENDDDNLPHFDPNQINQFYDEHAGRQGIAVLAFEVNGGDVDSLFKRYQAMHPKLIPSEFRDGAKVYGENGSTTKMLEVYSYYKDEKDGDADLGTKLRFVQKANADADQPVLPGFIPVEASFDDTCMPAYCDHWVSNVVSRTGFLETLEDTLGFTPKVDFNAGVVAAGEAQIESTVTGNDSDFETDSKHEALMDQSQVYLPINNALNEFSHVHGFLDEIGQGVQHIATRVDDLPQFIQRGNDFREITGEGFTFLQIPRSYYGVLTVKLLEEKVGLSNECAETIIECCVSSECMTEGLEGAVDLYLTREDLLERLDNSISIDNDQRAEFESNSEQVLDTILMSRYVNMQNLLGDILSQETYLSIVRNQILVDVQGKDILFQIFTSNILQREAGDESPFLEFIQRVCADCNDDGCPLGMKAGCGGFGIRNFLTLFLSIEIGKAMLDVSRAKASNDMNAMKFSQMKVDAFTEQLNESNPILTAISDSMTEEGVALEKMQETLKKSDNEAAAEWENKMNRAKEEKEANNLKLMNLNSKYNELMKSLRLSGESRS